MWHGAYWCNRLQDFWWFTEVVGGAASVRFFLTWASLHPVVKPTTTEMSVINISHISFSSRTVTVKSFYNQLLWWWFHQFITWPNKGFSVQVDCKIVLCADHCLWTDYWCSLVWLRDWTKPKWGTVKQSLKRGFDVLCNIFETQDVLLGNWFIQMIHSSFIRFLNRLNGFFPCHLIMIQFLICSVTCHKMGKMLIVFFPP